MDNDIKFKQGDAVNYKNGMDFKDFHGIIEKCIDYKGQWHYLIKDLKDNSVKRASERYLSLTGEGPETRTKGKFKEGDQVRFREERPLIFSTGIIQKAIVNYQGVRQYLIKSENSNTLKRVDEKYLELNSLVAAGK